MKNVPTKLSKLKSKRDELFVDKLVPVSVELCKLNDVVKNNVAKRDAYNAKIKTIEDKYLMLLTYLLMLLLMQK